MHFHVLLCLHFFQSMLSGFGSIRDGFQCGFGTPSEPLYVFHFLVTVGLRHLAIVMHLVKKHFTWNLANLQDEHMD